MVTRVHASLYDSNGTVIILYIIISYNIVCASVSVDLLQRRFYDFLFPSWLLTVATTIITLHTTALYSYYYYCYYYYYCRQLGTLYILDKRFKNINGPHVVNDDNRNACWAYTVATTPCSQLLDNLKTHYVGTRLLNYCES